MTKTKRNINKSNCKLKSHRLEIEYELPVCHIRINECDLYYHCPWPLQTITSKQKSGRQSITQDKCMVQVQTAIEYIQIYCVKVDPVFLKADFHFLLKVNLLLSFHYHIADSSMVM